MAVAPRCGVVVRDETFEAMEPRLTVETHSRLEIQGHLNLDSMKLSNLSFNTVCCCLLLVHKPFPSH
jgi:hypothetical protein